MKTSTMLVLAIAAVSQAVPANATSFSLSQCQSWFRTNDRNGDGALGIGENAGKYYDRITVANEDDDNFIMSRSFFIAECKIGSFGRPPA